MFFGITVPQVNCKRLHRVRSHNKATVLVSTGTINIKLMWRNPG